MTDGFREKQNRQGLAVSRRLNGNVVVELQVAPHAGAVGDVLQRSVLVDIVEHVVESAKPRLTRILTENAQTRAFEKAIAETGGGGRFEIR